MDWNMVAAIGQVLGALATFLAVIVALNQGKPRLLVKSDLSRVTKPGHTVYDMDITIVNTGSLPVHIEKICILDAKKGEQNKIYDGKDIPCILLPGHIFKCIVTIDWKKIRTIPRVYILDGYGIKYKEQVPVILEVIRWVLKLNL